MVRAWTWSFEHDAFQLGVVIFDGLSVVERWQQIAVFDLIANVHWNICANIEKVKPTDGTDCSDLGVDDSEISVLTGPVSRYREGDDIILRSIVSFDVVGFESETLRFDLT